MAVKFSCAGSARRSRLAYVIFAALTILLGLASRKFAHALPPWFAKNAGDILYATMVFWLAGSLFPTQSTVRLAGAAILFCFCIEFLKLSQLSWLVAARHGAGALIFGRGFHTLNLACYVVGVGVAAGIELWNFWKQARPPCA